MKFLFFIFIALFIVLGSLAYHSHSTPKNDAIEKKILSKMHDSAEPLNR